MTTDRPIPEAAEMAAGSGGLLRDTPHRTRLMRIVDRVAPFGMLRAELLDCIFDVEASALASAAPETEPRP